MTFVDFVAVPKVLLNWLKSNDAKDILEETKSKTGAVSISIESHRRIKVVTSSVTSQRAVKSLLELHLKNQKDIISRQGDNPVSNSNPDSKHIHVHEYNDARDENPVPILSDNNSKTVSFTVDESVCGYMIGQKGNNIRKVEKNLEVKISVNSQGFGKRVVTISGPDSQTIQHAREQVEFEEVFVPVTEAQLRVVEVAKTQKFSEWRNTSGCTRMEYEEVNQNQEGAKKVKRNKEGNVVVGFVKLVGTKPAVKLARDLLEAQLGYEMKFRELEGESPELLLKVRPETTLVSKLGKKKRTPKLKKNTGSTLAQEQTENSEVQIADNTAQQVETPLYKLWLQQQETRGSDSASGKEKNPIVNNGKQQEKKPIKKRKPQKRKEKHSITPPSRINKSNQQEPGTRAGVQTSRKNKKNGSSNKHKNEAKSNQKIMETPLSRISPSDDTLKTKADSSLDALLLNGSLSVDEYAARLVQLG